MNPQTAALSVSVAEAGIAIEQLKLIDPELAALAIREVAEAGIAIEQLKPDFCGWSLTLFS